MANLVHVKGLAELQKFLDQFTPKMEANVMRGALRAGAGPVRASARLNINNVSGETAKSLRIRTDRRGSKVSASVYTRRFTARFLEYGTAPHWISVRETDRPWRLTRRGDRMLSVSTLNRMAKRGSLRIGGNFVGASVEHPGAKPHPFLRPALDQQATAAVVAAGEYIKKRLANKHGLDTADITIEAGE
jgi:HK97 gp10 family phage protein